VLNELKHSGEKKEATHKTKWSCCKKMLLGIFFKIKRGLGLALIE
jgi:hypothetical protein